MSENLENIDVTNNTATEQSLDDFEQELFSGKAPEPKPVEKESEDDNVNDSTEENADPVKDKTETLDEEGEEDEGDGPSEPPKKESRAEKRIRDLVAKTRELERKLEEKETAAKPVETPKSEEQQSTAPKAPHWDDVDDKGNPKYPLGQFDPQFNADLVRFTVQEEQRRFEEKQATTEQQRRQQEAQEAAQREWESKLAPALERYPDFQDKGQELIDNFSDLEPNYAAYLSDTIRAIDNGPDVLYYLADNPELARDIVNKGPAMATVMLGRISAMFDGDSATTKTKETPASAKVTKAPTPPPRVRGTALPKTKDLDNLDDFEEALFGRG